MHNTKRKSLVIGLLLIIISSNALAGTSCEAEKPKPGMYLNASRLALEVNKKLNRVNPRVALLARSGTNLDKYGLHYSHVAFVVRDYPGQTGKWTVLHLLNECGTSRSSIYTQGLMNFFMDNLYRLDYQITLLDTATQDRLYQTILSQEARKMHDQRYNILAYPFSIRYQNSNQWVLEVIGASMNAGSKSSRVAVQHDLLRTGYKPSVIPVGAFSRMGASLASSPVAFDDHPESERRRNRFSTVTVDSVINYLKHRGMVLKS